MSGSEKVDSTPLTPSGSAGGGSADVNVKVVCRFRPENKLELAASTKPAGGGSAAPVQAVSIDGTQVMVPSITDT